MSEHTHVSNRASPLEPAARAAAGSTGSDRFRTDIEALRAVAVLAVIGFHAGVPGFSGGYVGVDVFFVISGFLITGQMLRDEQGSGFRFGRFYARRVRRLLPVATLVILTVLAGSLFYQSPIYQESTADDARSAALFYSNFRFEDQATDYFQEDNPPSPYQHFWSLSAEEQFYFIWPSLFALTLLGAGASVARRRRRLAVALVAISAVSFVVCVSLTASNQPQAFFLLHARAWELAIGALLAVGATVLERLTRRNRAALGWLGMVAIALAVVFYTRTTSFPGYAAALPVLGTAAVIAAGTGGGIPVLGPILAREGFQAGGRYSYSLYLWHWPVLILGADAFESIALDWKRALGAVLIGAVPATLVSYHLIEHPIRRSPYLRARTGLTLAMGAGLVVTSLVGVAAFRMFATTGDLHAGRPSDTTEAETGDDMPATDYVPSNLIPTLEVAASNRADQEPQGCKPLEDCEYGEPDAEVQIAVFGDSHAGHWGAALDQIADDRGWHIVRFARGACGAFLYPALHGSASECRQWQEDSVERIAAMQPDLILLSNYLYGAYDRDQEEWEEGIRAGLARLTPIAPVVALTQTPEAREEVPACLAVHLENTRACEPVGPDGRLAEVNDRFTAIVAQEDGRILDVTPWVCASERCPVVTANLLMYHDRHHFTFEFSRSRADVLADAIEAHLPASN